MLLPGATPSSFYTAVTQIFPPLQPFLFFFRSAFFSPGLLIRPWPPRHDDAPGRGVSLVSHGFAAIRSAAQKTGFEFTQTHLCQKNWLLFYTTLDVYLPNRPLTRTVRRQRPVFVGDAHLLVSCRSSSRVSTRTSPRTSSSAHRAWGICLSDFPAPAHTGPSFRPTSQQMAAIYKKPAPFLRDVHAIPGRA